MRRAGFARFLALIAALAVATPCAANDDPRAALDAAMQQYVRGESGIVAAVGAPLAQSLHGRLADDLALLAQPRPDGYDEGDWRDTIAQIVALDVDAIRQLADGAPAALEAKAGLHELFVRSRADGMLQPVALYVPQSYRAGTRAPLVVALHGNPQTESSLLGQPFLRRLAEKTGTIVVAPYGRGNYDYAEPAASDVYDLVTLAQRTLPVDPGRTYLVGYSMGAFSVFMIGPRGGYRWHAAMAIAGAVLNSGLRAVELAWQNLPLYVVTGAHDESIPARYGEQTAGVLARAGLPVSFYEEPSGSHALRTLMPALQRAWLDMHAGMTRPETVPPIRGFVLPQTASGAVLKP